MPSPSSPLEGRLAAELPVLLDDPDLRIDRVERIPGGNSRLTYQVRAFGSRGATDLVVQVARSGPVQLAEVEAMELACRAGVPAPEVISGGGRSRLGEEVLVTRRLRGVASPRRIANDQALGSARRALPAQIGAAVARLHGIQTSASSATRALDRLRHRYRDTGAHRPALSLGMRALARSSVRDRGMCLVHGDLRLGNLLVDRSGLSGILDWEVAHVGEPGEDLGWLLNPVWRLGGDGPLDGPAQVEQVLAAYEAVTGWRPDAPELAWWQLWGACLWVVACLELTQRSRRGPVPDAEQLAAGLQVTTAERTVLDLVEEVWRG